MGHKLSYLATQPTAYLLQGSFNTLYENILSNNMIYFSAEVQLQLKQTKARKAFFFLLHSLIVKDKLLWLSPLLIGTTFLFWFYKKVFYNPERMSHQKILV